MTLSARGRGRPALLFVAAVAAAILAVPRPAAAHAVACNEIWNPHGQTTPPAGWSTAPGTTNKDTPVNPDGFYQVGGCSVPGSLVCPTGLGGPEFAGLCYCDTDNFPLTVPEAVTLTDGCEAGNGSGITYDTSFAFGTIVKYTEANGKTPGFEPMAGSKQPGSPAGDSSDSVDWHLWGQGDLLVCSAVDPSSCVCCRVPPPPYSCEPGTLCPPLLQ